MFVWWAESEMMNEQLWYTPKYTGIQAVYLVYTSLTYEHVLARYTAGIQRWWAVYTYTGIHPVYRYTPGIQVYTVYITPLVNARIGKECVELRYKLQSS